MVPQHCFPNSGRYQAITRYSNMISITTGIPEGVKRRVLLGPKSETFTPRS